MKGFFGRIKWDAIPMPARAESVIAAAGIVFLWAILSYVVPGLASAVAFLIFVWLVAILIDTMWGKAE